MENNTDYASLYEYLGKRAGMELGQQVYQEAKKQKIKCGLKTIKTLKRSQLRAFFFIFELKTNGNPSYFNCSVSCCHSNFFFWVWIGHTFNASYDAFLSCRSGDCFDWSGSFF